MAFNHRILFPAPTESNDTEICTESCISDIDSIGYCPLSCLSSCSWRCPPSPPWLYYDPPPPPPPPPPAPQTNQNQHIPTLVLITVAVLATTFLVVSYYAIIKKYCSSWNSSRRSPPQSDDTREDFFDENHGPVVDHPIWFITTVGLQQSIINSITLCKYKKGEGLIEGTECSVCLNEFQEDETLRLLPKCSHAFHLPCIDTWLRSHTNCPLCRAHIVSNAAGSTEPNFSNSESGEENGVENSEGEGGLGNDQNRESGVSDMRVGTGDIGELHLEDERRDTEIAKECHVPYSPHVNCEFRVFSDLSENHRVVEDEIQPVRRSFSMDSPPASTIFLSLANVLPVKPEGSSAPQSVQVINDSNLGIVPIQVGENKSILKLMGSSSIGDFRQKGPISMKRSFSSGGKFLLSRNSQSRNSILPL